MSNEILAASTGLLGALLGGGLQWFIARGTIRAETERLHRQLSTEFRLQQFSAWQREFHLVMADLLAATDPDSSPTPDVKTVVPLIHRAQLLLNPHLPPHRMVNGLVNQLGLTVNGWHGNPDKRAILGITAQLIDAAREIMFLPGR